MARLSAGANAQLQVEDAFLIALAKQGNADACHRLVRRYYGFVRLKASSYFLAGGDSDDLIQEGLVGLYKAIRDYRSDRESSFRNFAELCITRQIITAVKTATRNKHTPLNQYVSFASTPSGDSGENDSTLDEMLPGLLGPRPGQPGDQLRGAAGAGRVPVHGVCPTSNLESSPCTWTVTPTKRSGGGWVAIARRWTTRSSGSSARWDSTWPSGRCPPDRGVLARVGQGPRPSGGKSRQGADPGGSRPPAENPADGERLDSALVG